MQNLRKEKQLMRCLLGLLLLPAFQAKAQQPEQNNAVDSIISLEEVMVTAPLIRHTPEGDEYQVTAQMKERGSSVTEVLGFLPGVKVNRMDNAVSVDNKRNVLCLVNGKAYSSDYIKAIDPERITRVKVIRNPNGRYVSEGYDAVIDLKVRQYDGADLSLSNLLIANPDHNDGDVVMMEQPSASFTYTQDRLSLFGFYAYGNSRWNTPYANGLTVGQESVAGEGMERYRYRGNVVNAGVNYRISSGHELSAELDYRHENSSSVSDLAYGSNSQNLNDLNLNNRSRIPTWAVSLFYQGHLGKKAELYSELVYNQMKNDGRNGILTSSGIRSLSYCLTDLQEKRKNVKYTLELDFTASDAWSFKAGYAFDWKCYDSRDGNYVYRMELDETEWGSSSVISYLGLLRYNARNKAWFYATFTPSDRFSAEAGTAAELERMKNVGEASKHYFHLLPSLRFNYTPSDWLNLNLAYVANSSYPTLAMLNPVHTALNTGVYQEGNPLLESSVSHKVTLAGSLFDLVTVSPQYEYIHGNIARLATWESPSVLFTYVNSTLKRFSVPVSVECPVGRHFNLSCEGVYYASWGDYGEVKKSVDGWWYGANLTWFGGGSMVDLGYSHSLMKENTLQGYQESGIDSWTLTANRQWLGGRLSTMLTWFLPLDTGLSRSSKSVTDTGFYSEHSRTDLKPYRNALILNITYRFSTGKSRKTQKRSEITPEERISGGMKF